MEPHSFPESPLMHVEDSATTGLMTGFGCSRKVRFTIGEAMDQSSFGAAMATSPNMAEDVNNNTPPEQTLLDRLKEFGAFFRNHLHALQCTHCKVLSTPDMLPPSPFASQECDMQDGRCPTVIVARGSQSYSRTFPKFAGLTLLALVSLGTVLPGGIGNAGPFGLSNNCQHLLTPRTPSVLAAEPKILKLLQADRRNDYQDFLTNIAQTYNHGNLDGNMRARPIFEAVRAMGPSVRHPVDAADAARFLDAIRRMSVLARNRLNLLRGIPNKQLEVQSPPELLALDYTPRLYPLTRLDILSTPEPLIPAPGPEAAEPMEENGGEEGLPDDQVNVTVAGRSVIPVTINVPVLVGMMRVIHVNATGPVNITFGPMA